MENIELKEKWIAALRSGEYKQGRCSLRYRNRDQTDSFCCLGVLCDIIDPNGWSLLTIYDNQFSWGSEDVLASLPNDILNEIDLDCHDELHLMTMNDNGETFGTIADYIERFV